MLAEIKTITDGNDLLTITTTCTTNQRQLRDHPPKTITSTCSLVAAAATKASADQQDSHQPQPSCSPSMQ
ncbi:hypothetical protein SynBIOSE41_01758 [Synechococcus sp. BIOS-E4-1]|nr:hypothetical protein SynBIOSE41_01758 [Synechococcus sp. BIOS-E4-1]